MAAGDVFGSVAFNLPAEFSLVSDDESGQVLSPSQGRVAPSQEGDALTRSRGRQAKGAQGRLARGTTGTVT